MRARDGLVNTRVRREDGLGHTHTHTHGDGDDGDTRAPRVVLCVWNEPFISSSSSSRAREYEQISAAAGNSVYHVEMSLPKMQMESHYSG